MRGEDAEGTEMYCRQQATGDECKHTEEDKKYGNKTKMRRNCSKNGKCDRDKRIIIMQVEYFLCWATLCEGNTPLFAYLDV
jgi:hypothetical protein